MAFAVWLIEQGRPQEARVQTTAVVRLDAASIDSLRLQGLNARYLREFAVAERLFEQLYQTSLADGWAANQLALVLAEQDDPKKRDRALQLAELNARLFPKSAEILTTLGRVYHRAGRLDDAERVLSATVSVHQNETTMSSETAWYLALLLADIGRTDDARKLGKTVIDSVGPFPLHNEAARWLTKMNENYRPNSSTAGPAVPDEESEGRQANPQSQMAQPGLR